VRGASTMRTGGWIAFVALLAACGRDREVLPLPEAPGPKSRVALSPLELKQPADFDRLDRQILSSGGPADLVKAYDDLARVAPDDPRILTRGALAALASDPETRGPAIAEGVLKKLAKDAPGNADAAWLALRFARLRLAAAGKPLVPANGQQVEALRDLSRDAAAFASAHPGWMGPFGTTEEDARRLGREADDAVAAWEAAQAAAPATDTSAASGTPEPGTAPGAAKDPHAPPAKAAPPADRAGNKGDDRAVTR
jgi:hypothetical protein